MRAAAVLSVALGVSSESAWGRPSDAVECDRLGAQSAHVVGVSGAFCVHVRPCEGVGRGAADERLSCPLAGQWDVLGESELPTDSCCAVVDRISGAVGCVLISETEERNVVCLRSADVMTRTTNATEALPVTATAEAAEGRASVVPEAGGQDTRTMALTSDPMAGATTPKIAATAAAPMVATTSAAAAVQEDHGVPPSSPVVATLAPVAPEYAAVAGATGWTTAPSGSVLAATSAPVAATPVADAGSSIPMPTTLAPSVAPPTTPATFTAAAVTVSESSPFSSGPVTTPPELSSMSDATDSASQSESMSTSGSADMMPPPEWSTMSGSADMMPPTGLNTTSDLFDTTSQSESSSMSGSTDSASQSDSMSTSGSADMMPVPEWSTMSGLIDADLALAPTPSPPALPPFTATSSSQSGSDLADGPPVALTTNATSPQLLTTPSPSEQRPASGSSDDISTTATSTVVVSGSASGSDASNETGSFPEVSAANMSTPVPTTMPAELSSSGNGSYPETGSRGVGPTGSVVGPRATAASPTMNSSSDPSPWLGNVGFGSGASSGSADVGDFWSSASKSRGDGSLDSVDSDNGVESYAGEVAVPSPLLRPSSESGPPPPSLPAPPLLFPSSGSLKSERVTRPPIKSPSSSGVLVLPPITDDSADSVDPLASGSSQTRVNDGESGGNSALGTSTILFIIVGCIVAAALVFGAVWLRPKRADPLEVCDPDESREPTDAYPYAGSESAGPYDASRTPRVITGYDRMDVRGSNEYFGA